MARAKRYSDVRRMLLRKLAAEPDGKLMELRDHLWDVLLARQFQDGYSVEALAGRQPTRNTAYAVENSIRRVMRRQRG